MRPLTTKSKLGTVPFRSVYQGFIYLDVVPNGQLPPENFFVKIDHMRQAVYGNAGRQAGGYACDRHHTVFRLSTTRFGKSEREKILHTHTPTNHTRVLAGVKTAGEKTPEVENSK